MEKWIHELIHDEYLGLIGFVSVAFILFFGLMMQETITNATDNLFKKKD